MVSWTPCQTPVICWGNFNRSRVIKTNITARNLHMVLLYSTQSLSQTLLLFQCLQDIMWQPRLSLAPWQQPIISWVDFRSNRFRVANKTITAYVLSP